MSSARSDPSGLYSLPQLSPGTYSLRVESEGYQPQELHELVLPVAGRLELNFLLRPLNDVWEAGQYRSVLLPGSKTIVTFYGPDIDSSRSAYVGGSRPTAGALDASLSQVVAPAQIVELPLAGRDVYTMLVTQPGITADTTTARSLGLSTNGQRPSASNFLLDGLENNNYLVTGPLSPIAPEAIQEYRISMSNFSPEYGRTAGYIANAVTRAGGAAWHGLGYFDLINDALNANSFQSNLLGRPRTPRKEIQPGFQFGGPIRRGVLFASLSYDLLRSRSRAAPVTYRLPTTRALESAAPDSLAHRLLTQFKPPASEGPGLTALYRIAPPVSVTRSTGLGRVDHLFSGGAHRLMGRFAATSTSRPDFRWTPYPDFVSGIDENTRSLAFTFTSSLRPGLVNEVRFGNAVADLNLGRAHNEIPLLTPADGTTLPSSSVFSRFRSRIESWEALDNVTWIRGRHLLRFGGGVLMRGISGILTAGQEGQYGFASVADFLVDRPNLFRVSLDRQALPALTIPEFDREYRSHDLYLFAQDTFRLTRRLAVNYGLRYERFGTPVNTGAVKDALVELGSGSDLASRLAQARLVRPPAGDERLYDPDRNDLAGRFGFSYNLTKRAQTLIRGAYGIFYDRPFDNVWQNLRNNNFVLPTAFPISAARTDYLAPAAEVLPRFLGPPVSARFANPVTQSTRAPTTMFQPGFRTPYVQSFFFGLQQPFGGWTMEMDYFGSLGRKLITNDVLNRTSDSGVGPVFYRGNQGTSSYNGFSTVLRYQSTRAQFQAAYTWSHAIDNQSEILRGDYFNLTATRLTAAPGLSNISAFTLQGDSSVDRGNADFDQRHNLVILSVLNLPHARFSRPGFLFRNWKFSSLAAFRSGAPFSVYAPASTQSGILNQRAHLLDPRALADAGTPVSGGKRLLPLSAFALPAPDILGNIGRNAFRGPGFYDFSASLSRTFRIALLGEAGLFTVRTDAFNLLNQANLNLPDNLMNRPTFGIARFGRAGPESGLPVLSPVNDTSRQIQLILRIRF